MLKDHSTEIYFFWPNINIYFFYYTLRPLKIFIVDTYESLLRVATIYENTHESIKNARVLKREHDASKKNADVSADQSFGKRGNGQNELTDKALKQVTGWHWS